jgi:uncharacterized membrane protein
LSTFDRYIVFLVLAACLINTILAFTGQKDLTVYFTINVIVYLVITLLHVYLNPRARKALTAVSIVLFTGFVVILVIKTIEVVSRK